MTRLLVLVIVVAGCTEPATVPTEKLGPVYIAQDSGMGFVDVHAAFSVENEGFYRLTEDETLVAKVGDQMETMQLSEPSDQNQYQTTLATDPQADTRFAVELYRASGELYTSTMGFPGRFEVSPIALSIARSETITITWAPADTEGDVTNVIVDGRPCLPVFDNGSKPPATVTFRMAGMASQCTVQVGFFRDRDADPNPAFNEPGLLEAEQSRVISFVSTL